MLGQISETQLYCYKHNYKTWQQHGGQQSNTPPTTINQQRYFEEIHNAYVASLIFENVRYPPIYELKYPTKHGGSHLLVLWVGPLLFSP